MRAFGRSVWGAVKMGLTWAVAWGAGVGGLIELVGNVWPGAPGFNLVDIWPLVLAVPGFIAGTSFGLVVRLAAGRKRFEELSLPGFTLLGALGGVLGGVLTVAFVSAAAGPPGSVGVAAMVIGVSAALSTLSAGGLLAIARRAGGPGRIAPGAPGGQRRLGVDG